MKNETEDVGIFDYWGYKDRLKLESDKKQKNFISKITNRPRKKNKKRGGNKK